MAALGVVKNLDPGGGCAQLVPIGDGLLVLVKKPVLNTIRVLGMVYCYVLLESYEANLLLDGVV